MMHGPHERCSVGRPNTAAKVGLTGALTRQELILVGRDGRAVGHGAGTSGGLAIGKQGAVSALEDVLCDFAAHAIVYVLVIDRARCVAITAA